MKVLGVIYRNTVVIHRLDAKHALVGICGIFNRTLVLYDNVLALRIIETNLLSP